MSRNTLIILIIAIIITLCCCTVILASAAITFFSTMESTAELEIIPTAMVWVPTPTEQPQAIPTRSPQRTPTPLPERHEPTPTIDTSANQDTETQLKLLQIPSNDPIDLARRLRPELGDVSATVRQSPFDYTEGDIVTFWVGNSDTDENWQIEAELRHKSEHLYMWVERDADIDQEGLERSATLFDNQIYPTNRAFFGDEWTPGIDGDPRLHVLHAYNLGDGVAGYFSSADEIPNAIHPYSNEKEMFYVNLDSMLPGTEFYNGVLAHEFQHMIHWFQDLNETNWLDEGAAELAMEINGISRSEDGYRPDHAFADNPDLQLNDWPDSSESYAHYGNAYLYMTYFMQRFGETATQALIANPVNSMESVDITLQDMGLDLTADDVFADWVIANWLDDPSLGTGQWGYANYDLQPFSASQQHRRLPARGSDLVHQYAADYVTFQGEGDILITFEGNADTRLAATNAYSGDWSWWSHRTNLANPRLTLAVDLTDVDTATLRYHTWYDIEDLWDYAYVEVSTDDAQTWQILETDRTTRENPNGNAFGPGYTGLSGRNQAEWVEEVVDLTPFAGQEIDIRFEYVTDTAVTGPGIFIDDVSIPEIGFFDDFENGSAEWTSEGWLLTNNQLRQRWIVQVIEPRSDGTTILHRLPIDDNGRGTLSLDDIRSGTQLVLVVSALAPDTVETAFYEYTITQP